MKFRTTKSIWAAVAIAAMLAPSCTTDETPEKEYTYPWEDISAPSEVTLNATIEGSEYAWAAGDYLFVNGSATKFAIAEGFAAGAATFNGSLIIARYKQPLAIFDPANGKFANFSESESGDVLYAVSQQTQQTLLYGVGGELSREDAATDIVLKPVVATHNFEIIDLPTEKGITSLEIAFSEPLITTASFNMTSMEVEVLTSDTSSIVLATTVADGTITASANILPQAFADTNECKLMLVTNGGELFEYVFDAADYKLSEVQTTQLSFADMTLAEGGGSEDGGSEDGGEVKVTLSSITIANTSANDTWYVSCGTLAKEGYPTTDEMAQFFSVLKSAVAAGREITIEFTDMLGAGTGLFLGNTDLTVVKLPLIEKVSNASVFEGCTSLRSVSLPAMSGKLANKYFLGCTALTSINAPEGETGFHLETITETGNYSLQNCSAVTAIYAPAIAKMINMVFAGCTSLTTLELATTAASLEVGANLFGESGEDEKVISNVDLTTGAANGTTVEGNNWIVDESHTYKGFKSITVK